MAANERITWLSISVLEEITADVNQWYPKETGGILIGYWNENQAVITKMINCGPQAIHKENSFIPDHQYQVIEIEKLYQCSGRTEVYLGDWHSHPGSNSYMSWRDQKTLKKIAYFKDSRLQSPMMMIIGTSPPELKIWFYVKRKIFHSDILIESQVNVFSYEN
jgi:integrative and conjugative element protein (TIGR02256 family)